MKRSIDIISSHPRTRRERRKQVQTLKRSMKIVLSTAVIVIAAIACIAFVLRKKALNNIEALEIQAKKAKEITDQKTTSSKNLLQNRMKIKPLQQIVKLKKKSLKTSICYLSVIPLL